MGPEGEGPQERDPAQEPKKERRILFVVPCFFVLEYPDWIGWITEPKKPETRSKRLERAAERLGKGLKTIY